MTKDDTVIICGDFGLIWEKEEDRSENYWLKWLEDKPFTTVFVDGNHENHKRLATYPKKEWNGGFVHEIRPHILHLMRGEVYTIEGKTFFAFGGASSHDISDGIIDGNQPDWKRQALELERQGKYRFRVEDVSWWKEELPSKEEMENGLKNLAKHNFKVDYVITHCCPSYIAAYISNGEYKPDILTDYFQELIYKNGLDFKKWIFGHYHDNRNIFDNFALLYEEIIEIPTKQRVFSFDNDKELGM